MNFKYHVITFFLIKWTVFNVTAQTLLEFATDIKRFC